MNKIFCLLLLACSYQVLAQTSAEKQKTLYGICTKDSLIAEPFGSWYNTNYETYKPSQEIVSNLKKEDISGISIKVFFGTWCGDSKREVPRVLKMLECCNFPAANLTMIMVSNKDSLYKKSPQHEEAGKNIVRVPTIIIEQKGVEIGRIIEFPIISLEKDLLAILRKEKYQPNYHQLKADAR